MTTSAAGLRVTREGGVCVLTLDRPERRNALSVDLRLGLAEALAEIASDELVRCTVVTGAGPVFCSGMDHTEFGGPREQRMRLLRANEAFVAALLDHPLPLVAAVNGPALGGGFVLAALCDLRIAARSASFGFPEAGRGIPPSLGAALAALPPAAARDLAFTGRTIDAAEAAAMGLVSAVADDDALLRTAVARADAIAALPVRATQTIVRWARHDPLPWREQLDREGEMLREVLTRD